MTSRTQAALAALAIFASLAFPPSALAQTVQGFGEYVTIPIVADTPSFTTAIYLHPGGPLHQQFQIHYYGADGSATPGHTRCSDIVMAGNSSVFSLGGICSLNPGSNFGRLVFSPTLNTSSSLSAYARVRSTAGNGFSVEGVPLGAIANGKSSSYVLGLERSSLAPGYQSNCFVAALEDPVTVNLQLEGMGGGTYGNQLTYALQPNQLIRILDIFAASGSPAGEFSSLRARFWAEPADPTPSFLGFCTVQNNTSFNADFRIAKVAPSVDDQTKLAATSVTFAAGVTTDLGKHALPTPVRNATGGLEHLWTFSFQHPERATCSLTDVVPPGEGNLRMVDPIGNYMGTGLDPCQPLVAGYLWGKTMVGGGISGQWQVRVTSCTDNVPLTAYKLTCTTGSGSTPLTYSGYVSPTTF